MIKFTPEILRILADTIEQRSKYDSMCGAVYLTVETNGTGKEVATFEQPCQYKECNSYFYRFSEK